MKMNKPLLLFLLLLLLFQNTSSQNSIWKLFTSTAEFLTQGFKYQREQVFDTTQILREYDFIIIGGGTAGCIIANRLSENPQHTVLLLEAGGDENYALTIPLIAPYFYPSNLNWGHRSVKENACLAYKDGRCNFPRGKVLGGSSTINGMFFTRGNKKDYDRWLEMGNYGWGYEDVLPYFKKLEDLQIPEYENSNLRGKGGPVPINFSPYQTPLGISFFNSLYKLGYSNVDYNGEYQSGFSKVQLSTKNSSRFSMNRAYLMPIKYRKNLNIVKNAFVTRILIDSNTKVTKGVEFIKNNKKYQIFNKKEVILSAGAFGSPQILMLSGIGPEEHLNELNIPVIKDLKVGYNLQDHVSFAGLLFLINDPLSINFRRLVENIPNELNNYFINKIGPMTSSLGSEGISVLSTSLNNDTSYPDFEIVFSSTGITQDPLAYTLAGIRKEYYDIGFKHIEHLNAFTMLTMLLRPLSVGRLTLKSNNPYELPNILINYFKEERDTQVMLKAIRFAIKISESNEFKKFGTKLHEYKLPGCNFKFNSDEFWICAMRQFTLVAHHFSCTAKMGPKSDPYAVVDPELRVYGIQGLRVIDASIMPLLINAHTAAPVMMIGEKGADLVKSSWYGH